MRHSSWPADSSLHIAVNTGTEPCCVEDADGMVTRGVVELVYGRGTIVEIPTPGGVTLLEDVGDLDGAALLDDGDAREGTGGVTMLEAVCDAPD
jgi:hypothetical protein